MNPISSDALLGCLVFSCVLTTTAQTQEAWVARFNGFTNAYGPDIVRALAVDRSGNVYVCGEVTPSDTSQRGIATVKYSNSGQSVWTAFHSPGLHRATPIAIGLDDIGQPCVAGTSADDFFLIKYNSDGLTLWQTNFSGPGNTQVAAVAWATDCTGASYLTGYWISPFGEPGYGITVKYNSSGHQLWSAEYHAPAGITFRPTALAVNGTNGVVVTGTCSLGSTGFTDDIATVKYDAGGNEVWRALYDGPGHSSDRPTGIVVDEAGVIYVTGTSAETVSVNTRQAYATLKYHGSGTLAWADEYNVDGAGRSYATAIVLGGDGSVYVTGWSWQISEDFATIKYSPTGSRLWIARFDGVRRATDKATALAVDDDGNVYVAGSTWTNGFDDYVTIKYDGNGNQLWIASYDGPVHQGDDPVALTLDVRGNVYVTGNSKGSHFTTDWSDYATIKYAQPPLLSPLTLLDEGGLHLSIQFQYRADYRLESSENLSDWTEICTITNGFGTTPFSDPVPAGRQRFYRAVMR